MRQDPATEADADAEPPVSKTRRKKEMHELQALGERLTGLNNGQLAALPMPEDLRDAILDFRGMTKHEARRRQLQYIGRIMREVDAEPIREKLREWDGQSRGAVAAQHRLERWRDRLIEEEAALAEFIAEHRGAAELDIQHLRGLIRQAREERAREKPPKHYRELYRELKRIADSAPGSASAADDAGAAAATGPEDDHA